MNILTTPAELSAQLQPYWQNKTKTIALIPTMGNLHQGHLDLITQAQSLADTTIVSIFVNPLQFGPNEDYQRYPRSFSADIDKLATLGVDFIFHPQANVIYPQGHAHTTRIHVTPLETMHCGAFRPQFFSGVATIVAKLLQLTKPDIAIFGEKDFQQLRIIEQMSQDLCFPVNITSAPISREIDGLARSSRNAYLTTEERSKAPQLLNTLHAIATEIKQGGNTTTAIYRGKKTLDAQGFKVDYIELCDLDSLHPVKENWQAAILLAAATLGKTRLIDNLKLHH